MHLICYTNHDSFSGTLDIMASAILNDAPDSGNLWRYVTPEDFRTPNWERVPIATGFAPNNYALGNKQSPGKQRVFWPSE